MPKQEAYLLEGHILLHLLDIRRPEKELPLDRDELDILRSLTWQVRVSLLL